MATKYDEDEKLAVACSNYTTRSMSILAMTGMCGAGPYGKTTSDCFYDGAANRTSGQEKRGSADKGRISLGITHAVGSQAVAMINKLGIQSLVGVDSGDVDQDTWDYEIDTAMGWREYGINLRRAFDAIALGTPEDGYLIQIACYKALNDAWDMVQAHPSPNCKNLGTVVALSRILNSYGKYAYFGKYSLLFDMLGDDDPMDSLLKWYAARSSGKTRRAQFIRKLVGPYGVSITELGEVVQPGGIRPAVATLREAQEKLKDLGYYTSKIDGDFGPGSEKALFNWCEAEGHDFDEMYDAGIYLLPLARDILSKS